jgi:hypothetical protein
MFLLVSTTLRVAKKDSHTMEPKEQAENCKIATQNCVSFNGNGKQTYDRCF